MKEWSWISKNWDECWTNLQFGSTGLSPLRIHAGQQPLIHPSSPLRHDVRSWDGGGVDVRSYHEDATDRSRHHNTWSWLTDRPVSSRRLHNSQNNLPPHHSAQPAALREVADWCVLEIAHNIVCLEASRPLPTTGPVAYEYFFDRR